MLTSAENVSHLKACLNELAYDFVNSSIDSRAFLSQQNHYQMVRLLNLGLIFINKGSGVVILNYSDYINKILSILDDTSKFQKLGDRSIDDTNKTEVKFQER